jgi:hypothetical protein
MALGRGVTVAIGLAALLNACSAQRLGLTWEIAVFTPRVPRGGDLVFRVETKDAVGELVQGVDYECAVDWTDAKGNTHRGSSCKEQHLRINGPKGPAALRIFAANEDGTLTEMATAEFQIE